MTRRIQVSTSTDLTVLTTAVQCSSLLDGILLIVDAGLIISEPSPHHLPAGIDSEDEDLLTNKPDPDFDPLADNSDSDEEPEE